MATKKSGNPFAQRNASPAQKKAVAQKNMSRGAKVAATKKYKTRKK